MVLMSKIKKLFRSNGSTNSQPTTRTGEKALSCQLTEALREVSVVSRPFYAKVGLKLIL